MLEINSVIMCNFSDKKAYSQPLMQAQETSEDVNQNQSRPSRIPSKTPSRTVAHLEAEPRSERRTLLDSPTERTNETMNEGYLDQSLEIDSIDNTQTQAVSMNPAGSETQLPTPSPDEGAAGQNPGYVPGSPTLKPNLPFPGQPYENPKS